MNRRIYFVDFARSFAIMLALLDHSMNDFNVWHDYPHQTFALVKTFTSSATPTFLFLFGMMIQIIYLKRVKKYGYTIVSQQLVLRSFQCFIGYFLTVVAGFIGGTLDLKGSLMAVIFLGNAHFGNILKLYTVVLLMAIPILWVIQKRGIGQTMLFALAIWLLYPVFNIIPPIHGSIDNLTSYLFGFGGKAGPSILFGLTLVIFGGYMASFISFEKPKVFRNKVMQMLLIVGAAILIIQYAVGWEVFLENLTSNTYRRENNPIYYMVGSFLALFVTLIFSMLVPLQFKINPAVNSFLVFGRSSLLAFTLGNVILNLLFPFSSSGQFNEWAPFTFIVLVFTALMIYEMVIENINYGEYITPVLRKIKYLFIIYYVRPFARWITKSFQLTG